MKNIVKNNNKKITYIIISVLCLFMVASAVAITFAWLADSKKLNTNTSVGKVGIEIYYNGSKVNGTFNEAQNTFTGSKPIEISNLANNSKKNLNIQVKNSGTIDGLLRVTFNAYYVNADGNNISLNKTDALINFNNCVEQLDNPNLSFAYNHKYLYNSVLKPNTLTNLTTDITAKNNNFADKTVKISVVAEIIAYSGNAYKVNSLEKPFGNVPAGWTAWK